jgi:hypothetical protein
VVIENMGRLPRLVPAHRRKVSQFSVRTERKRTCIREGCRRARTEGHVYCAQDCERLDQEFQALETMCAKQVAGVSVSLTDAGGAVQQCAVFG